MILLTLKPYKMKTLFFNIVKAFFITLIVVSLIALISNLIVNPGLFASASFGGF